MATTINKQRLLNQLSAIARKGSDAEASGRPVLEEFIYALCREHATPEQADQAYSNLRERFFDWNEVRVSSLRELEDAFDGLPDAAARAERLVSFLQEVFETTFSFDLEGLHKKGLKQAAKQLTRYQAANDYVCAWVTQRSLGGHAIPIDPPTLRTARRMGLLECEPEDLEAARSSLEHLIAKSRGPQMVDLLSDLADQHCWEDEPNCPSCPMAGDCATAHEAGVESLTVVRAQRAKPR